MGEEANVDLSTARLTLVSGDDQQGTVGETAPDALTVQVVDTAGAAIGGVTVEWVFAQGMGRGSANSPMAERVSATTDEHGNTSVRWALGSRAGAQRATAEISIDSIAAGDASGAPPHNNGKRVGFVARAVPSSPDSVTVEPSSVLIESGEQTVLNATVTDKFGNVLEDVSVDWSSIDPGVASVEDSVGAVQGVSEGNTSVTASAGSVTGEASVDVEEAVSDTPPDSTDVATDSTATSSPTPQSVGDLTVSEVTDSTITVRWTQVDDGYGEPANYVLRAATPEISWGEAGDMQDTFLGTELGVVAEYTWTDLAAGTQYEFQLVPHSGEFGVDAVFGSLSNIAREVTATASESVDDTVVAEPTLSSLEIRRVGSSTALSTLSLSVGETVGLEAIGLDESGGSMGVMDASWASSNPATASVSTLGEVSALEPGSAQVRAEVDGLSTFVDVTVQDTTSTPEHVTTTYDNEPEGFVAAVDGSFDWDRIPDQYDYWGWWQRAGSLNIVTDPTAPTGGDEVGQFFYPAGMPSGNEPGVGGYNFRDQEPREFFAGWWGKVDADWIPHPFQLKWTIMGTNHDGTGWFWTDISGGTDSPNLRLRFQGDWGMEQLQPQNVQADLVPFVYGEWTKIEVYARYGDPGQSNGEFKLWQNGTLIVHVTGVEVPGTQFMNIHHTGTYGGCCHDVPQDQAWYIAHTYVSIPGN